MLSVSMSSDGWTTVTPSSGSRVIYVSESGSDRNSGLSSSSPVQSISRGVSLLRDNSSDQLLLNRGDSWSATLGFWTKGGKSSSEPLVIGAYGSGDRPTLNTGDKTAFMIGSKSAVNDVDIIGVHLQSQSQSSSQPTDGIQILGQSSNVLIEDCEIDGYRNNIVLQKAIGSISNVTVRKNVITDSYSRTAAHSQGIYADGVAGLTLDSNVFDHNGWKNTSDQTQFNHDAYVTAYTSGLVAKGNVFANASSHGLQARCGGVVENNVFINDAVGLTFGLVNGSPVKAGGVTGDVRDNVFVGTHTINGSPRGTAMEFGNIKSGSGLQVTGNLIANGDPNGKNAAINIGFGKYVTNASSEVGINDLTIQDNVVYKWGRAVSIASGLSSGSHGAKSLNNVVFKDNDFQQIYTFNVIQLNNGLSSEESWSGNTYSTRSSSRYPMTVGSSGYSIDDWKRKVEPSARLGNVSFPDAGRSVDSYAGSTSGFLSGARNLAKGAWNTKYTASSLASYLRSGYFSGVKTVDTSSSGSSGSVSSGSSSSVSASVDDVSHSEGNSGKTNYTFTVSLSSKSSSTVTVDWKTLGDSAHVDSDYVGRHGTLTFNPGDTSKTVTIQVIADRTRESDERFTLNLIGAHNASIADNKAWGTVKNDD